MIFIVEKSTASKNKGYVNTLVAENLITVFGVKKTVKHRFLFKTDEEIKAGTQGELNLAEYTQVAATSEVLSRDGSGAMVTINTTWLHRKAS